ncbi:histidinol dehydrogenase [Tremella mesenterica]|uniref:Histidine biosynthesis trifunctional protein n=1 Tax=Tremella mesenterica TaxID=5217 RepID=A0A4Q1BGH8_TREME|nr:uncharacterized protein TREMEDRAFT_40724 [Tremella mesenterica DSM 1558]EIW66691.1 hypothetical protein TREMEDRAFT_40724 [Tremella mesenterica DSM 1558]RXK36643.1 histidinol dehydrogenase [Tremella mesenterica]
MGMGPTFVPLIDPTAAALIPSLALLGPLLLPASLLRAVLPSLTSTASYWVLADDETDLISVLNEGAEKVILSPFQLSLVASVPSHRLILHLLNIDDTLDLSSVSGVYIDQDSTLSADETGLKGKQVYLSGASISSDTLLDRLRDTKVTYIIPTSKLTTGPTTFTHLSIPEAFLAPLTSDRPDGLFPTIVSTTSSSPLGLVYSSAVSVTEAIVTQKGIYQSRKHGLWRKGETSGAVQDVISIRADCDSDSLLFTVVQHGEGFCHLPQSTCFGSLNGVERLQSTLERRLRDAPEGSYTKRLFDDEELLRSKIMEEAEELCEAEEKEEVAFEMADLVFFALTRCVSKGVKWEDVERALDRKSLKVTRRKGDAKPKWVEKITSALSVTKSTPSESPTLVSTSTATKSPTPVKLDGSNEEFDEKIQMRTVTLSTIPESERSSLLLRPVLNSLAMIDKVRPIVERVRKEGDAGLLSLTYQFDRAQLTSNVLLPPYPIPQISDLPIDVRTAIDIAYSNVRKFHEAQAEKGPLIVHTMPGVVCSRFARPIARVGIYVPGGTAILPSTAIMLGVPAQVAGCKEIVLATPPRPDGSISPEVLYVARLTGVTCILKAGGAQAVAAMAYGTKEVPKVDKIFGPGNQWVTAAKMLVQNDTDALVGIDMPAGPSEVLVIADQSSNPTFVASDLLSQAEHGVDSQVVLVAVSLSDDHLAAIETAVDEQARALPRVNIAKEAIKKSLIIRVDNLEEGMRFSNEYAPEHLILHLDNAKDVVDLVDNAGSVFVGAWSPESCGDYASGTNHTLPTNGYARQFSGVNTLSFQKHITAQELTSAGLEELGPTVVKLAEREGLEGHANAVRVRLAALGKKN